MQDKVATVLVAAAALLGNAWFMAHYSGLLLASECDFSVFGITETCIFMYFVKSALSLLHTYVVWPDFPPH